MPMATRIAAIYRYPVKGLSPERLDRVALRCGRCLPQDRRFAIALPSTRFDPEHPEWLPKTRFVMLMRDEKLARLQTRFDEASGELAVKSSDRQSEDAALRVRLGEPEGKRALAAFLDDFLGPAVEHPLRIVEAPGHAFADARRKPKATADQYVSLINLASIAALEAAVGTAVDPLRFRANVYFAGAPAWSELGWEGSEITLGGARLKIVSAITRCAATQVNPATGERDLDIVAALQRSFGHNLMGVYGEVVTAADIATGDELIAPTPPAPVDPGIEPAG
jgi:MOSC domain-containing protein